MKKAMPGIFLALTALTAMTASASTTRDVEVSTVVDGTLVVAKDGTVQNAVVKDEAKYGEAIAGLVRKATRQWRFYPIVRNGEPVVAKADMHVRVVLKKTDDGNYDARVKGATFGDAGAPTTDEVAGTADNKERIPRYPQAAVHSRVQGTVYLALHIDRTGHVTDAAAEQVNLANSGPEGVVRKFRDMLAKAALETARQWTYTIPTTGRLARQDSWTVQVPVKFILNENGVPAPKRVWDAYIPGPYTPAPWLERPNMDNTDAVASDSDGRTVGAGPILRPATPHI